MDPLMTNARHDVSTDAVYNRTRRTLLPHMAHMTSSAPNALYGPEDLLNTALAMCNQNQFVTTAIRAMMRHGVHIMTEQRFLQLLGAQPPDDMLETSLDILESTIPVLKESGRLGGQVRVGVGEILLERYDVKNPNTREGRGRTGPTVSRNASPCRQSPTGTR